MVIALVVVVRLHGRRRTMKTAFAYWDNRIAPVFDTARRILVVESYDGRIIGESEELLEDGPPVRRTVMLSQLGIATLVCGAISRPLREMILSSGIEVIPFIAGDLGEITRAWQDGELEDDRFAMPGCCGRRRFNRRGACCDRGEEEAMNRGRGGGQGTGRGPGQGGGSQGGGPIGFCVCATCGHREPHQRGTPCVQKQCPKCGSAMTRE
jgi:predicted Fe-Mo cluster-binding NifX family protein